MRPALLTPDSHLCCIHSHHFSSFLSLCFPNPFALPLKLCSGGSDDSWEGTVSAVARLNQRLTDNVAATVDSHARRTEDRITEMEIFMRRKFKVLQEQQEKASTEALQFPHRSTRGSMQAIDPNAFNVFNTAGNPASRRRATQVAPVPLGGGHAHGVRASFSVAPVSGQGETPGQAQAVMEDHPHLAAPQQTSSSTGMDRDNRLDAVPEHPSPSPSGAPAQTSTVPGPEGGKSGDAVSTSSTSPAVLQLPDVLVRAASPELGEPTSSTPASLAPSLGQPALARIEEEQSHLRPDHSPVSSTKTRLALEPVASASLPHGSVERQTPDAAGSGRRPALQRDVPLSDEPQMPHAAHSLSLSTSPEPKGSPLRRPRAQTYDDQLHPLVRTATMSHNCKLYKLRLLFGLLMVERSEDGED